MWTESNRSRARRDHDEGGRGGDDEEDWDEGSERRKHRSGGKSRRHGEAEEADEQPDSAKRKSTGDRGEVRRKVGKEDDGDDEDYDSRRDSRSKLPKKSTDDRAGDRRSSDGFRDVEPETSGRKGRADENTERDSHRKVNAKEADSQSRRSSGRVERGSHEGDHEKLQNKDSKYSEKKDVSREKTHDSREQDKSAARRRWDEGDPHSGKKTEDSGSHTEKPESRSAQASDHSKVASSRDKALDARKEPEGKSKGLESSAEKTVIKSTIRDEKRRQDGSRDDKQRRDYERPGEEPEGHRTSSRSNVDKGGDKYKQQREPAHMSRDEEVREKKLDDDGHGRMRDRGVRDMRPNRRSRTPDRRHHREPDDADRGYSESDNERGSNMKGKERERDAYRDDRLSKGKDGGWNDRSRERESSKDHWRRSHMPRQDRDHREADDFDYDKDWESKRREQEWLDNERHHGRPSYRKDNRSRIDSMRPSSDFPNANDHSDSIEIKPNRNLDFGREEPMQSYAGRRNDVVMKQQDVPSGGNDDEWGNQGEDRGKMPYSFADDFQERFPDEGSPGDQNIRRNSLDNYGGRGRGQKPFSSSSSAGPGQGPHNSLQPPFGSNQGPGSMNRNQQGVKGGRQPRGGRGRMPGRDAQRVGLAIPMMGPPFGHLGMPPGPLQPMGPNMPPSPAPPIGHNVFLPPFPGPLVWAGARGIDMNMLAVPPSLSPIPPGPVGPRFGPNMTPGPNHGMFFDQPNPGRGVPSNAPGPAFNPAGSVGRGGMHDKPPSGWTPNRSNAPAGKAPSRGEQNDYSQNFVDTGMRPQNFIRELELTSTVEDYPKLRELIQKKDEIVTKSASAPMYHKCDLREFVLSPEFFGTKFDVILVDPPWEEYVHRAPGVADHMDYWTFEEILNLKIEAIADTPSFIFLWVGDGVGLEQGRQCLKKWGFRRCEDICWVKTNKSNAAPSLRHDSHTLFQHTKEHCLMGIKGTVRRSTDGHIIHANIDTDIIIAEEPPYGSTKKPDDIYRIIEHFSLGRRRLELFGEDHNIRSGWLTVGKDLSSSNFNSEAYCRNFADKDGKVWQGGGGRNPPPEAPHLVVTTSDIESLRPKSPPQKSQQPQSTALSTTANSAKRQSGNSSQNPIATPTPGISQEASSANPPAQWGPSVLPGPRGSESGNPSGPDDNFFDGFAFNSAHGQTGGEHIEFEPHRTVNMM